MQQVDYRFENHGSIFLCQPLNGAAKDNLDQACEGTDDFHIRWGDALVIVGAMPWSLTIGLLTTLPSS